MLKNGEGIWQAHVKIWTDPEKEPIESKGVKFNRVMPGGLWLIQNTKGESEDHPYHGHGIVGYDTNKKKYVAAWADSMNTSLTVLEGTYDEDKGTLTFTGDGTDPKGHAIKVKVVVDCKDEDHHVETLYVQPAGKDKMTKVMEITSKRVSGFEMLKGEIEKFKRVFEKKKWEEGKGREARKKRWEERKKRWEEEKKKGESEKKDVAREVNGCTRRGRSGLSVSRRPSRPLRAPFSPERPYVFSVSNVCFSVRV